ncbi:MAG: CoA ester lyase [bacterium]
MQLRRSVLFMPGDSLRKIEKAAALDVDVVVMDLEDGVALAKKEDARRTVVDALKHLDFGRSERWVRINVPTEDFFREDLELTAPGKPDAYVIPKVSSAEDVRRVEHVLEAVQAQVGDPAWRPRLVALIETARGVVQAPFIAESSERLVALMFGAEDFAGDVGAERTPEGAEVAYARGAVVVAAKAAGLDAIDTLCTDLTSLEVLVRDAAVGRRMGYDGKMCIHPKHVEPIHRAFDPRPEQIAHATRLLDAFRAHQERGAGAFDFEGKMVDMPMVRAAEKVLARARAAGLPASPDSST